MRIAIVGDVRHSRVARSNVLAFTTLGAEVVLVGPATLLPTAVEGWPVTVAHELDPLLGDLDAVYLLRMQSERISEGLIPSIREYAADFGLSAEKAVDEGIAAENLEKLLRELGAPDEELTDWTLQARKLWRAAVGDKAGLALQVGRLSGLHLSADAGEKKAPVCSVAASSGAAAACLLLCGCLTFLLVY